MNEVTLERFAYTPFGAFGRITVGNKQWYTVERPWLGNKAGVSCVPEGTYTMKLRESGVVNRTTKGAFTRGWEVTGVPGRSLIMIHVGNTMDDLEGCIAPGKTLGFVNGKWAVQSSRAAFDELMAALAGQKSWQLTIHQTTPAKLAGN